MGAIAMLRISEDIELSLTLASTTEASSYARRAIDDRFGRVLPKPFVADLMTVVSELMNNAVSHGPGAPVTLRLMASRDGRSIAGEVQDDGLGRIAMRDIDGIGGGFGLHIVDALVDRWGVHEGSTQVWFEMTAR